MGVRIGGFATISFDGNKYELKANMEVRPSSVRREGVAGQDEVHGYLENPIVPQIKGDFSTIPGLSLDAIEQMTNVTVQADLANGSSYILTSAWTVSAFAIQTQRGQVEITFEGVTMEEITAA